VWPLVPVYAAGLMVREGLRRLGVLRVRRLAWPVISVGSLSAGGAGKTPVVIALAELLRARGWGVDVLSRGYGRTGRGVERVDVDAMDAAARFGDEPVMMARRLLSKGCADGSHPCRKERGMDRAPDSVPVWVGAERYAAGVAAESAASDLEESEPQRAGRLREEDRLLLQEEGPELKPLDSMSNIQEAEAHCSLRKEKTGGFPHPVKPSNWIRSVQGDEAYCSLREARRRVHLLDDGFQHWGVDRAVDVVLVTEEDLEEVLLPAGNRREPLAALRRADVVVLREAERERVEARVRGLMRADAAVWCVRREPRFDDAAGGSSAGARPLGFCAIARPEGFWAMLAEAGCELAGKVAFGDHHGYALVDMERLVAMARECGATGFITTEKDAVKLSGGMLERLREVGPVCEVGLEARFVDEADVLRELEARIG
jgi:tetraacyldisaccharide-1-P 4'-kinase